MDKIKIDGIKIDRKLKMNIAFPKDGSYKVKFKNISFFNSEQNKVDRVCLVASNVEFSEQQDLWAEFSIPFPSSKIKSYSSMKFTLIINDEFSGNYRVDLEEKLVENI